MGTLKDRRRLMRKLLFAGVMIGFGLAAMPAFSQTSAPAQPGAAAPGVCPEGQARGPDGSCTVTLPATPHQREVLEPAAGPTSPAAGAATQCAGAVLVYSTCPDAANARWRFILTAVKARRTVNRYIRSFPRFTSNR